MSVVFPQEDDGLPPYGVHRPEGIGRRLSSSLAAFGDSLLKQTLARAEEQNTATLTPPPILRVQLLPLRAARLNFPLVPHAPSLNPPSPFPPPTREPGAEMLYEKQSPLLPSYYSRRWNATRHANVRTRLIIVLGLVGIMLTSLLLLNHFTTRSPPRSNLHGLKTLKELETLDISQNGKFSPIKPPPERQEDYDDGSSGLPKVANATLDFGKIFVLNLETREDRHDEMALIAAATGLEFTYVPGVDSKALETQAMPDTYGTENIILKPGHLACYRGHANIWQRIVEEGIDTALILEDDVDWDLNIREIVPNVKEGMTRITGADNPFSNTPGKNSLSRPSPVAFERPDF